MSEPALPHGWAAARIEKLISHDGVFIDGDWVESKDQDPNGDVRLIQLADVGDGSFRNKSSRFLTMSKAIELRCTFLQKGDLLIARMPEPLGRACIFPLEGSRRFVTVVDVCILRTSSGCVSSEFLCHSINFLATRKQIEDLQIGTTRKRISRKNLATVTIPLPPLNEQKRIVARIEELFSELDAGEESLRKARRQLGTYRQSLLKQAFEGKLTAPWREQNPHLLESAGDILDHIQNERLVRYNQQLKEWEQSGQKSTKPRKPKQEPPLTAAELDTLSQLPQEWCWEKNERYVFEVKDGTHYTPKYVTSGIPFITQKHIQEGRIIFEDFKMISIADHESFSERSNVEYGDLLISMIGKPGSCALVRTDRPFSIKNVGLFKFFQEFQANEFLCYFYQSLGGLGYVMKFAKGGYSHFWD